MFKTPVCNPLHVLARLPEPGWWIEAVAAESDSTGADKPGTWMIIDQVTAIKPKMDSDSDETSLDTNTYQVIVRQFEDDQPITLIRDGLTPVWSTPHREHLQQRFYDSAKQHNRAQQVGSTVQLQFPDQAAAVQFYKSLMALGELDPALKGGAYVPKTADISGIIPSGG